MLNTTIKFVLEDGELKPITIEDSTKYKMFVKSLTEGAIVELYLTRVIDENDCSLGQLAKVHVCIRDLARFTGHTFTEIKDLVKEKAGLVYPANNEYKSFADCTSKELSDAIQMCITIGNEVGYYMH